MTNEEFKNIKSMKKRIEARKFNYDWAVNYIKNHAQDFTQEDPQDVFCEYQLSDLVQWLYWQLPQRKEGMINYLKTNKYTELHIKASALLKKFYDETDDSWV